MRSLAVSLVLVALFVAGTPARGRALPVVPHVRALDKFAQQSIEAATTRSPTVRRMIEQLAATDVVVFVQTSWDRDQSSGAHLSFLSEAGGFRYLTVRLLILSSPDRRVEWLGHELQHALEVSQAPWVRGQTDMSTYFQQIGWRSAFGERYETGAAKEVAIQVRKELNNPPIAH